MNWTKEKPTVEGWYWYAEGDYKPEIIKVTVMNIQDGSKVYYMLISGSDSIYEYDEFSGVEWYGPIEPPKHDKE